MVSCKQLGDDLSHTYTEEQYDQCVTFLSQSEELFYGCANYMVVGADSSSERLGCACHFDIRSGCGVANIALVATQFGLNKQYGGSLDPLPPVNKREFARWVMNDSHFAHLMVNKPEHRTVDWLLSGGGFIVSSELPQPLLQMMMILSRTLTERLPKQFDQWARLVEKGCDPHFAYNIAMCVGDKTLIPNNPVTAKTGHTPMYLLSNRTMDNFVRGELGDLYDKISYRIQQGITGCHLIFGYQGPNWIDNFIHQLITEDDEFRKRLAAFRNLDTASETYRPPNPFQKQAYTSPLKPTQVTYEELFGVVVDYVLEKGLFKNHDR